VQPTERIDHLTITSRSHSSAAAFRYQGSGTSPSIQNFFVTDDRFYMDSTDHSGYERLLGRMDIGSSWRKYASTFNVEKSVHFLPYSFRGLWYGGRFIPYLARGGANSPSDTNLLSEFSLMESKSRSMAPTAIAKSNPSVPMVDLGTAIGEVITGGVPSLIGRSAWQERTKPLKGAGSEYLNYQFGWKPLISDIRDTALVVSKLDKHISDYQSESGKNLHRGFGFPPEETSTTTVNSDVNQVFPSDTTTWQNGGRTVITRSTTRKLWFKGCFRYYVPDYGFKRHAVLGNKFFGARITPSTLWNLAPWSWALDWQANIGDVMSNLSYLGFDASVMLYGYFMHEYEVRTRWETSVTDTWGKTHVMIATATESYKDRIRASPYSFSANPAPLTGKQQAIVAALILSRT